MNNYFDEDYTELIQEGIGGGFNKLCSKTTRKKFE